MRSYKIKKIIALGVTFCFLWCEVVRAAPELRLENLQILDSKTSTGFVQLPAELGSVDEIFIPENDNTSNLPFVFHVQTVHANPEASRRIGEIINYLNAQYRVRSVFAEGASGDLHKEFLQFLPGADTSQSVLDMLTAKGELTGVDLAIASNSKLKSFGIEDPGLYREAYKSFRSVIKNLPQSQMTLEKLRLEIDRDATQKLEPGFRELVLRWIEFVSGKHDFLRLITYLTERAEKSLKVNFLDSFTQFEWPQVTRLVILQELENRLDADVFDQECRRLKLWMQTNKIGTKLPLEQLEEPEAPAQNMRLRKTAEGFLKEAGPKGFQMREYPQTAYRIGLKILHSEIDSKKLFTELNLLFEKLLAAESSNDGEIRIVERYRKWLLLNKLLHLELTPENWHEIKALNAESQTADLLSKDSLGSSVRSAINFYRLMDQREQVFFKKIHKAQNPVSGTRSAILVTGGFHAAGMKEFFRKNGIGYAVISPHISGDIDSTLYHKVMLKSAHMEKPEFAQSAAAIAAQLPGDAASLYLRSEMNTVGEAVRSVSRMARFEEKYFADRIAFLAGDPALKKRSELRAPGADLPEITVNSTVREFQLNPYLAFPHLVSWFQKKRWFMEKESTILGIEYFDAFIFDQNETRSTHGIIARFRFRAADGKELSKRYFIPVVVAEDMSENVSEDDQVKVRLSDGVRFLILADKTTSFQTTLLNHFRERSDIHSWNQGKIIFNPHGDLLERVSDFPVTAGDLPMSFATSNILAQVNIEGDGTPGIPQAFVSKTYKDARGIADDEGHVWPRNMEGARYEALTRGEYTNIPKIFGNYYYQSASGERLDLGVLMEFIDKETEAGGIFWNGLGAMISELTNPQAQDQKDVAAKHIQGSQSAAAEVAGTVARMHQKLLFGTGHEYESEVISRDALENLIKTLHHNLDQTLDGYQERAAKSPRLKELIERIQRHVTPGFWQSAESSLSKLNGLLKKGPVHGDLSTAQGLIQKPAGGSAGRSELFAQAVLSGEPEAITSAARDVTAMLRWVDFEGVPAKDAVDAGHDQRESWLKDIGGILQGFWYIAHLQLYEYLKLNPRKNHEDHENARLASLVLAGLAEPEVLSHLNVSEEFLQNIRQWLVTTQEAFLDAYFDAVEQNGIEKNILADWDRETAKAIARYFLFERAVHEFRYESYSRDWGWDTIPGSAILSFLESNAMETIERAATAFESAKTAKAFDGGLIQLKSSPHPGFFSPVDAGLPVDGIFLPFHHMRHSDDWGVGNFYTAKLAGDFLHAMNYHVTQDLPYTYSSAGNSPYSVLSRFLLDPVFVSAPEAVRMFERAGIPVAGWHDFMTAHQSEITELKKSPTINYAAIQKLNSEALQLAWKELQAHTGNSLWLDFQKFLTDNREMVDDDLLFLLLIKRYGGQWRKWPDGLADFRNKETLAKVREELKLELMQEAFVQFILDRQKQERDDYYKKLNISTMVDMAIAPPEVEVWKHPEAVGMSAENGFVRSAVQGVPGKREARVGQLWNFSVYQWMHPAAQKLFIDIFRTNLERADYLRIDQTLAIYRIFGFLSQGISLRDLGIYDRIEEVRLKALDENSEDSRYRAADEVNRLIFDAVYQKAVSLGWSQEVLDSVFSGPAQIRPNGNLLLVARKTPLELHSVPIPTGDAWQRWHWEEDDFINGEPKWDVLRLTPNQRAQDNGHTLNWLFPEDEHTPPGPDDQIRTGYYMPSPGESMMLELARIAQEMGKTLILETLGAVTPEIQRSSALFGNNYFPVVYAMGDPTSWYDPRNFNSRSGMVTFDVADTGSLKGAWHKIRDWSVKGSLVRAFFPDMPGENFEPHMNEVTPEIHEKLLEMVYAPWKIFPQLQPSQVPLIALLDLLDLANLPEEYRLNIPGQGGQWVLKLPEELSLENLLIAAEENKGPEAAVRMVEIIRRLQNERKHFYPSVQADQIKILRVKPDVEENGVQIRKLKEGDLAGTDPFLIQAAIQGNAAEADLVVADQAGRTVYFPMTSVTAERGMIEGVSLWAASIRPVKTGFYEFWVEVKKADGSRESSKKGQLIAVSADTDLNPVSPDYALEFHDNKLRLRSELRPATNASGLPPRSVTSGTTPDGLDVHMGRQKRSDSTEKSELRQVRRRPSSSGIPHYRNKVPAFLLNDPDKIAAFFESGDLTELEIAVLKHRLGLNGETPKTVEAIHKLLGISYAVAGKVYRNARLKAQVFEKSSVKNIDRSEMRQSSSKSQKFSVSRSRFLGWKKGPLTELMLDWGNNTVYLKLDKTHFEGTRLAALNWLLAFRFIGPVIYFIQLLANVKTGEDDIVSETTRTRNSPWKLMDSPGVQNRSLVYQVQINGQAVGSWQFSFDEEGKFSDDRSYLHEYQLNSYPDFARSFKTWLNRLERSSFTRDNQSFRQQRIQLLTMPDPLAWVRIFIVAGLLGAVTMIGHYFIHLSGAKDPGVVDLGMKYGIHVQGDDHLLADPELNRGLNEGLGSLMRKNRTRLEEVDGLSLKEITGQEASAQPGDVLKPATIDAAKTYAFVDFELDRINPEGIELRPLRDQVIDLTEGKTAGIEALKTNINPDYLEDSDSISSIPVIIFASIVGVILILFAGLYGEAAKIIARNVQTRFAGNKKRSELRLNAEWLAHLETPLSIDQRRNLQTGQEIRLLDHLPAAVRDELLRHDGEVYEIDGHEYFVGSNPRGWDIFAATMQFMNTTFKGLIADSSVEEIILSEVRKRQADGKPFTLLDWGAGAGQFLSDFHEKARAFTNVKLIGFGRDFYALWPSLVPEDASMIFDDAPNLSTYFGQTGRFAGIKIDFLVSHFGLQHHLKDDPGYLTREIYPLLSDEAYVLTRIPTDVWQTQRVLITQKFEIIAQNQEYQDGRELPIDVLLKKKTELRTGGDALTAKQQELIEAMPKGTKTHKNTLRVLFQEVFRLINQERFVEAARIFEEQILSSPLLTESYHPAGELVLTSVEKYLPVDDEMIARAFINDLGLKLRIDSISRPFPGNDRLEAVLIRAEADNVRVFIYDKEDAAVKRAKRSKFVIHLNDQNRIDWHSDSGAASHPYLSTQIPFLQNQLEIISKRLQVNFQKRPEIREVRKEILQLIDESGDVLTGIENERLEALHHLEVLSQQLSGDDQEIIHQIAEVLVKLKKDPSPRLFSAAGLFLMRLRAQYDFIAEPRPETVAPAQPAASDAEFPKPGRGTVRPNPEFVDWYYRGTIPPRSAIYEFNVSQDKKSGALKIRAQSEKRTMILGVSQFEDLQAGSTISIHMVRDRQYGLTARFFDGNRYLGSMIRFPQYGKAVHLDDWNRFFTGPEKAFFLKQNLLRVLSVRLYREKTFNINQVRIALALIDDPFSSDAALAKKTGIDRTTINHHVVGSGGYRAIIGILNHAIAAEPQDGPYGIFQMLFSDLKNYDYVLNADDNELLTEAERISALRGAAKITGKKGALPDDPEMFMGQLDKLGSLKAVAKQYGVSPAAVSVYIKSRNLRERVNAINPKARAAAEVKRAKSELRHDAQERSDRQRTNPVTAVMSISMFAMAGLLALGTWDPFNLTFAHYAWTAIAAGALGFAVSLFIIFTGRDIDQRNQPRRTELRTVDEDVAAWRQLETIKQHIPELQERIRKNRMRGILSEIMRLKAQIETLRRDFDERGIPATGLNFDRFLKEREDSFRILQDESVKALRNEKWSIVLLSALPAGIVAGLVVSQLEGQPSLNAIYAMYFTGLVFAGLGYLLWNRLRSAFWSGSGEDVDNLRHAEKLVQDIYERLNKNVFGSNRPIRILTENRYYGTAEPGVIFETYRRIGLSSQDVVVDLGAGYGRWLTSAAVFFGARARGSDLEPAAVEMAHQAAKELALAAGKNQTFLNEHVDIRSGDLFKESLSDATVIVHAKGSADNILDRVEEKILREARPGTRVILYGTEPDVTDFTRLKTLEVIRVANQNYVTIYEVPAHSEIRGYGDLVEKIVKGPVTSEVLRGLDSAKLRDSGLLENIVFKDPKVFPEKDQDLIREWAVRTELFWAFAGRTSTETLNAVPRKITVSSIKGFRKKVLNKWGRVLQTYVWFNFVHAGLLLISLTYLAFPYNQAWVYLTNPLLLTPVFAGLYLAGLYLKAAKFKPSTLLFYLRSTGLRSLLGLVKITLLPFVAALTGVVYFSGQTLFSLLVFGVSLRSAYSFFLRVAASEIHMSEKIHLGAILSVYPNQIFLEPVHKEFTAEKLIMTVIEEITHDRLRLQRSGFWKQLGAVTGLYLSGTILPEDKHFQAGLKTAQQVFNGDEDISEMRRELMTYFSGALSENENYKFSFFMLGILYAIHSRFGVKAADAALISLADGGYNSFFKTLESFKSELREIFQPEDLAGPRRPSIKQPSDLISPDKITRIRANIPKLIQRYSFIDKNLSDQDVYLALAAFIRPLFEHLTEAFILSNSSVTALRYLKGDDEPLVDFIFDTLGPSEPFVRDLAQAARALRAESQKKNLGDTEKSELRALHPSDLFTSESIASNLVFPAMRYRDFETIDRISERELNRIISSVVMLFNQDYADEGTQYRILEKRIKSGNLSHIGEIIRDIRGQETPFVVEVPAYFDAIPGGTGPMDTRISSAETVWHNSSIFEYYHDLGRSRFLPRPFAQLRIGHKLEINEIVELPVSIHEYFQNYEELNYHMGQLRHWVHPDLASSQSYFDPYAAEQARDLFAEIIASAVYHYIEEDGVMITDGNFNSGDFIIPVQKTPGSLERNPKDGSLALKLITARRLTENVTVPQLVRSLLQLHAEEEYGTDEDRLSGAPRLDAVAPALISSIPITIEGIRRGLFYLALDLKKHAGEQDLSTADYEEAWRHANTKTLKWLDEFEASAMGEPYQPWLQEWRTKFKENWDREKYSERLPVPYSGDPKEGNPSQESLIEIRQRIQSQLPRIISSGLQMTRVAYNSLGLIEQRLSGLQGQKEEPPVKPAFSLGRSAVAEILDDALGSLKNQTLTGQIRREAADQTWNSADELIGFIRTRYDELSKPELRQTSNDPDKPESGQLSGKGMSRRFFFKSSGAVGAGSLLPAETGQPQPVLAPQEDVAAETVVRLLTNPNLLVQQTSRGRLFNSSPLQDALSVILSISDPQKRNSAMVQSALSALQIFVTGQGGAAGSGAESKNLLEPDELEEIQVLTREPENFAVWQKVQTVTSMLRLTAYAGIDRQELFKTALRQRLNPQAVIRYAVNTFAKPSLLSAVANQNKQLNALEVPEISSETVESQLRALQDYLSGRAETAYPGTLHDSVGRFADAQIQIAIKAALQGVLKELQASFGNDAVIPAGQSIHSGRTMSEIAQQALTTGRHESAVNQVRRITAEKLRESGMPEPEINRYLKDLDFANREIRVENIPALAEHAVTTIQMKAQGDASVSRLSGYLAGEAVSQDIMLRIHTDIDSSLHAVFFHRMDASQKPRLIPQSLLPIFDLLWPLTNRKAGHHYRVLVPRGSSRTEITHFFTSSLWQQQFERPDSPHVTHLTVPHTFVNSVNEPSLEAPQRSLIIHERQSGSAHEQQHPELRITEDYYPSFQSIELPVLDEKRLEYRTAVWFALGMADLQWDTDATADYRLALRRMVEARNHQSGVVAKNSTSIKQKTALLQQNKKIIAPFVHVRSGILNNPNALHQIFESARGLIEVNSARAHYTVLIADSDKDAGELQEKLMKFLYEIYPADAGRRNQLYARIPVFTAGNRMISHFIPKSAVTAWIDWEGESLADQTVIPKPAQSIQIQADRLLKGERLKKDSANFYGTPLAQAALMLLEGVEESGLVQAGDSLYVQESVETFAVIQSLTVHLHTVIAASA